MDKREQLIVALDVDTIHQAQVIAYKLRNITNFYKIGWRLFMAEGMHAVHVLSNEGYNIFLDLKLNDIPNTIKCALHNMPCIHNVRFFTLMGSNDTVKAATEGLKSVVYGRTESCKLKTLHVTRLSSDTLSRHTSTLVVGDMMRGGLGGIVTSGNLVSYYRNKFRHGGLIIVVPGVRLESDSVHDHQNLNTVESAFENGADYIVVGRPIIEASNITQAAKEYIRRIP